MVFFATGTGEIGQNVMSLCVASRNPRQIHEPRRKLQAGHKENSRFVLVEPAPQQLLQFVASRLVDRRSQYHQRNVTVPDPLDLLTVPQQRAADQLCRIAPLVCFVVFVVHIANARLDRSQVAVDPAGTPGPANRTADRQRSQSLEGGWTEMTGEWQEYFVARIFFRDQMGKITDQRSRRTR